MLDCGQWTMRAVPDRLLLRVEAPAEDGLQRIQELLAARLSVLGRRERLTVTWAPAPERGTDTPGSGS